MQKNLFLLVEKDGQFLVKKSIHPNENTLESLPNGLVVNGEIPEETSFKIVNKVCKNFDIEKFIPLGIEVEDGTPVHFLMCRIQPIAGSRIDLVNKSYKWSSMTQVKKIIPKDHDAIEEFLEYYVNK
jgi:hypothetical protein